MNKYPLRIVLIVFGTVLVLMTACSFGAAPAPTATPGPSPTGVPPTSSPQATLPASPTSAPQASAPQAAAPTQTVSAAQSAATVPAGCTPGTGKVVTLASELKIEDLLICDGAEAKNGMTVSINFIGTLRDGGAQFDNSYDRGQPYSFILGSGPIQGWDQGIVGMKVGSKRRLTIPPNLAYGNQSQKGIPPNSTLVYDIELVSAR